METVFILMNRSSRLVGLRRGAVYACVALLVLAGGLLAACDDPAPAATRGAATTTATTTEPSATVTPTPTTSGSTSPPTAVRTPSSTATTPTATPTAQRGDAALDLAPGQTANVPGSGWRLRFDEVTSDSRCPADVTCVWAGEATLRLIAQHTDGRTVAVEVTTPGKPALLDNLTVEIVVLTPTPRSGSTIRPADYRARIAVRSGDAPPIALSGVRGVVTQGPMCPVQRIDQPCPDQPYQASIVVQDLFGAEVARTRSGPSGEYTVALLPGEYVVRGQNLTGAVLPRAGATRVSVEAGRWANLDITFDTGIR